MNYPVGPCTSSRTVFGLPAVFHLFSTQALSTTPLLKSPIREKDFLPVEAQGSLSLPLSPKRTQVRLKSLLYLVWLTPDVTSNPRTSFGQECRLRLKRPPPNAARRCPPFKSSTAFRALAPGGLFPWGALLRSAFGQKIWHTIFFSSKANFKILPKPRGASPFLKNSPGSVHPR